MAPQYCTGKFINVRGDKCLHFGGKNMFVGLIFGTSSVPLSYLGT